MPTSDYKVFDDNDHITLCLNDVKAMFIHKGSLANRLWKGEEYELKELQFFLDNLEDGSIFLDVGAGIGYFSIVLKLFKPGITVWGFEPCRATHRICLENLRLNGLSRRDVTINRLALSNYKGKGMLKLHEQDGLNTLGKPFAESKFLAQEETEVTMLDLFLKDNGIDRVDVIKVDIEGGELRLFQGAMRLLNDIGPLILFENMNYRTSAFGHLPQHVQMFLESCGYEIQQLSAEMFTAKKTNNGEMCSGKS